MGERLLDDYANTVCSGLLISGLYDEFALRYDTKKSAARLSVLLDTL